MKKCSTCGKEYPDKVKFCVNCGKPLGEAIGNPSPPPAPMPDPSAVQNPTMSPAGSMQQPFQPQNQNQNQYQGQYQGQYQSQNIQQNTSGFGQPTAYGGGYNSPPVFNQPGGVEPKSKSGSNGKLIAIIITLALVTVAAGIVIFIMLNKGDEPAQSNPATPTQEASVPTAEPPSDENQSGDTNAGKNDADDETVDNSGKDESEDEKPTTEEEPATTQDTATYQEYYDSVAEVFGKLIMSGAESGQFSAYLEGLGNALNTNDVQACEYNYGKLKELEEKAERGSKKKISKLKKKLVNLKSKSSVRKAKSSATYIKNETEGKIAADSGDYKKAKAKFSKCIFYHVS